MHAILWWGPGLLVVPRFFELLLSSVTVCLWVHLDWRAGRIYMARPKAKQTINNRV